MTGPIDVFSARRMTVAIEGGDVALLRFGRAGAPPMLFAHANGFCASAYRRTFEALGDSFDIFAADLRGHGRTRIPAPVASHRSMAIFGDDLRRTKSALRPFAAPGQGWIFAGHSLGGVAATEAAAGDKDIAALRLIEPVAMPKSWAFLASTPAWPMIAPHLPLVRAALRRRDRWPDAAAAFQSYAQKPFFAGWAGGVLADYLEDGLHRDESSARLSCAPAWEAANFAAQANDFWGALPRVLAPVSVLAARHRSTTLRGGARERFRRLGARVELALGVTHLLPFEAPERAARFLAGEAQ